jgi:hypothetical protein
MYRKPELVVIGNSVWLIQNHVCKSSSYFETPVPEDPLATPTAYEADE